MDQGHGPGPDVRGCKQGCSEAQGAWTGTPRVGTITRLRSLDFKGNLLAKPPPGLEDGRRSKKRNLGRRRSCIGQVPRSAGHRGGGIHAREGASGLQSGVSRGQADESRHSVWFLMSGFKKRGRIDLWG